MKYIVFSNQVRFGDYTAFVYDSPNNRYNYASGEICDEVFDNVTPDTEFEIVGIDELPEVKNVIIDNFLQELAPAKNVVDDNYNEIKELLENGCAKIGYWNEETKYGRDTFTTTTYMLIL